MSMRKNRGRNVVFFFGAVLISAIYLHTERNRIVFIPSSDDVHHCSTRNTSYGSTAIVAKKLNILLGLSGGIPAFIDEFAVTLKSVLLQAPNDARLDVHLIVDEAAYAAVLKKFNAAAIEGSVWRNPISIIFYVLSKAAKKRMAGDFLSSLPPRNYTINPRVGVGTLFRLFADNVLPKGVGPVVYIDKDVVILSNLNALERVIDTKYIYQVGVGNDVCAGFMVINIDRCNEFWHLLKEIPDHNFPAARAHVDDQMMLALVKKFNEPLVGNVPLEWHNHLAHGYRDNPHELRRNRTNLAMLHFNGVREKYERWWDEGGVMRYCKESIDCSKSRANKQLYRESWNLAEYAVNVPWSVVLHHGAAAAGDNKHPLKVILARNITEW